MKFSKLVTSIGLTVSSVLFVSNSAQAASFKSNVTLDSDNPTTGDVILNSITQNNQTFNRFSFVNEVKVLDNDEWTGGNTGAASTDRGINASLPEFINEDNKAVNESPTTDRVAAFLGNNNLNNIIDTEDNGTFNTQLFFDNILRVDDTGLYSLFFYERGKNSNMLIQAIDKDGNLVGRRLLLEGGKKAPSRSKITDSYDDFIEQQDAGFAIETREIKGSTQDVGSWGVSLADLDVRSLSGIQITANGSSYKGPDFKVVARSVPEPGSIIGLGSVAALAFFRRRKSK
ncbi:MAG: exosortase-dependent surface protein XDP2 [Rivularia sp. (in: cyanobacteria)]